MSERGTTLTAQALAKRDGDPAGVVERLVSRPTTTAISVWLPRRSSSSSVPDAALFCRVPGG